MPEHKSSRVDVFDRVVNLNNSSYKTLAAEVLIWKNESGDILNLRPHKFSYINLSPSTRIKVESFELLVCKLNQLNKIHESQHIKYLNHKLYLH